MPDDPEDFESTQVQLVELQEEMERSFLEYSMSVIISRALPDARDGLKPVHRRILYSMFDNGYRPDRPHVKCAKVVGDVMGKFHPHGDAAIYDALARMVQDFSLLHPLIDGHGNFGAPDPSTGPAASRYTECRLAPIALQMLASIDEETVNFVPNYDSQSVEPSVLPARFPNLLVNGSQGIAVGMATQIPSHNLAEIVKAVIYVIDHPDAVVDDLLTIVPGPDFPTGGQILGREGIVAAYRTGRGSVRLRAVAEIEEVKNRSQIVVTDIPFQTSFEQIAERIKKLVEDKLIDGISDVQNYSSGRESRFVIELKRDANPNVVLNNLYKLTPLQSSFAINMLAIVDGVPRTLNLLQAIQVYIEHQREVVTRRSEYRLRKARERLHIVDGLLRCIDQLDAVIRAIRESADRREAREALMASPFDFSELQANHILDMTLGRLTRLGRTELEEESAQLHLSIAELEAILADRVRLDTIVKEELVEASQPYEQPRRSQFVIDPGEFSAEDLIEDESLVVMISRSGYIKAVPDASFRAQNRGARGVVGAKVKEEDGISHLIPSSMLSKILIFSSRGKVYQLRGYELPRLERSARGTALVNLIPLQDGESIAAVLGTKDFPEMTDLVFITEQGMIKRTPMPEYARSRRDGLIAIDLREGDSLVKVATAQSGREAMIFSKDGMVIRFSIDEVRSTGRATAGVKAMRLRPNDRVIGGDMLDDDREVVLVTSNGYGKRISPRFFSAQRRGGGGVHGMKLTAQKGYLVAAEFVSKDEQLIIVSSNGQTIRVRAKSISAQGKIATGVKLMTLQGSEVISSVGVVQDTELEEPEA
ncbi:DNA gyrase subunit A [Ferrimicrobium acidiphilum]|uniref:DNA gyrase subunit A n=1 Tax=Ferrimicrobium acidiphilum TaxID=121039 RepID=UPI0023F4DD97|nr:DNA gyrase subunit A [Ferrimicrobium acidiphilum]